MDTNIHERFAPRCSCGAYAAATVECPRERCLDCCDTSCCRCCHAATTNNGEALCGGCATEMAMDRAEMDREDCRAGLCAGHCGRDV